MDEFGLPVLSLRTLTHSSQRISEESRGVVRGHVGGQLRVNNSHELFRIDMKKQQKQFNTGKPTNHRKDRSISPNPDRFAIIRLLIPGKPKVLPFVQGQANYSNTKGDSNSKRNTAALQHLGQQSLLINSSAKQQQQQQQQQVTAQEELSE
jgi:hypothetical protein